MKIILVSILLAVSLPSLATLNSFNLFPPGAAHRILGDLDPNVEASAFSFLVTGAHSITQSTRGYKGLQALFDEIAQDFDTDGYSQRQILIELLTK